MPGHTPAGGYTSPCNTSPIDTVINVDKDHLNLPNLFHSQLETLMVGYSQLEELQKNLT